MMGNVYHESCSLKIVALMSHRPHDIKGNQRFMMQKCMREEGKNLQRICILHKYTQSSPSSLSSGLLLRKPCVKNCKDFFGDILQMCVFFVTCLSCENSKSHSTTYKHVFRLIYFLSSNNIDLRTQNVPV